MSATDVDAVIAALRVVLHQAEHSTHETWWQTHVVNKWIDQLPGRRWGRWRQLQLRADVGTEARRDRLITHVRATLAYLESNRDAIAARRSWWPFGRSAQRTAQKPAAAAVKEEAPRVEKRQEAPTVQDGTTKPKWLN